MVNERVRAFLLMPPAFALLGALIAAPHVVHVLDDRSTVATVAEIAAGTLPSRNVTITALVLADRGLKETVTKEKSQTSPRVSFYMPIADPGGAQGPTQVVVHTFHFEVFDAAEHPDVPLTLEGTVRDVLWEGLDGDVKKDLAAQHPLSPDVKLLELRGTANADDKLWTFGAPLAGLLLGLLVASNFRAPTKGKPDEAAS